MNIALIFAGGVGSRMGASIPKQFLQIDEKPILVHTLEVFQNNQNIDAIVIASLSEYIPLVKVLCDEFNITKVKSIVPGGKTGQLSIFNIVEEAHNLFPKDSVVLINDGVRPFLDNNLINANINNVRKKGSTVSAVMSTETFIICDDNMEIVDIPERKNSLIVKAPQSFILDEIYQVHLQAQKDGITDFIDSCTLMNYYGKEISVVMTDYDNIKITTPKDVVLAQSIYNRRIKDKGKI